MEDLGREGGCSDSMGGQVEDLIIETKQREGETVEIHQGDIVAAGRRVFYLEGSTLLFLRRN